MPIEPRPDALWIIDGYSQIFRAYYAIRSLSAADGTPTNAIYGFLQILKRLIEKHSPKYLAVALDAADTNFRNELFEDYKANRDSTPEDLREQIPLIKDVLAAMHIPMLSDRRYEADDLIATLAERCCQTGHQLVIVSSDKDLFQLVHDDHVIMARLRPQEADVEFFDCAAVRDKMGVHPTRVVDYQALIGDPTDNIPGVPGIGPKSAVALLEQFDTLEDLLAAPEQIEKKRWRTLVTEHAEQARLSYKLALLARDAPIECDVPNGFVRRDPDTDKLAALYERLEFHGFLRDLGAAPAPPAEAPDTNYTAVADTAALEKLAKRLRAIGHFAFDTETTSTNSLECELVGISVSPAPGESYYIPVGHTGFDSAGRQLEPEAVRAALGPIFADAAITKSAHNAKFDIEVLHTAGYEFAGLTHDTMVLAHLTDSERGSNGLKQVTAGELNISMQPISELIGSGKNSITFDEVAIADAVPYACADADMTLRLEQRLEKQLEKIGTAQLREQVATDNESEDCGDGEVSVRAAPVVSLYHDVEMPLVDVLTRMEEQGIGLDTDWLAELGARFETRLTEIRGEVAQIVDGDINLNSPKQIAELLFTKLGLPVIKKTKTGPSTDVTVLEELAPQHPIPGFILQHRLYEKLLGTYINALPKLVNRKTGRIHASFNQVGAATGRLSCTEPNLQNIPIRTEEGRLIRRAFIPSQAGSVLIAADYSQIELRLLAHISGDETLINAFRDGDDVHRITASKIYGVDPADVTREQRGAGKTINFGIVYGMSAFRLAGDLNIEQKVAKKFIEDYFASYPGVAQWIEATKEEASKRGYVTTLLGRRRRLADIGSRNNNQRQAAERIAINAPIQGTAADLIKVAMIALDRRLADELPSCKLLLQVHDELVLECPAADAERATSIVREAMEGVAALDVPLVVDAATGANWADCK